MYFDVEILYKYIMNRKINIYNELMHLVVFQEIFIVVLNIQYNFRFSSTIVALCPNIVIKR